jgi:FtsP/CotA-like multicopper oxidase with cupredoxin domain
MSHICPAQLEFEGHSMLIVASDSYDLEPVEIDKLYSTSGERYDFVITANASHGKKLVLKQILNLNHPLKI